MSYTLKTIDYQKLLSSISENSVDLILTDPPYTISRKTGFQSIGKNGIERFAVSMDFGKWDHKEIDLNILAKESFNALKEGGTIIVFYDLWKITKVYEAFKEAGFKMIRLIIWEKTNPVPLNSTRNYLSNSREVAVLGVKGGKPTFNGKYHNGVYPMPIHREKRFHPTQKPIKLMEALIETHSNPKDLIVDPFMGAGTTGLAAIKLKRKFIGGDIDNKYKVIARRLLEKEETKKRVIFRTGKTRRDWPIKESLSA